MRPRRGLNKLLKKLPLAIAAIVGILIGTVLLPDLARQAANLRVDRPAPRLLTVLPATVGGARVTAATISPSGTVILGTADGNIYIEKNPMSPLGSRPIHVSNQSIFSITSSEDSHTLAGLGEENSGTRTTTSVWIWKNGFTRTIPMSSEPSIALSGDGNSLAVIRFLNDDPNESWQPVLYDLNKNNPMHYLRLYAPIPLTASGQPQAVGDPKFSPDGHSLGIPGDDEIYVLDLSSGQYATPFSNCPCNYGAAISDNWSIVTNSFNSDYMEVWDLKHGGLLGGDRIFSGTFVVNGEGTELAIEDNAPNASALTRLIVWNIRSGRELARIYISHTGNMYESDPLTFSKDGHLLLVGTEIWEIK